jgi:hypothetical protein
VADYCECGNEPLGSIPWLPEELLATQEGLCSIQLLLWAVNFAHAQKLFYS